jgi:hypothetical protein
VLPKKTMYFRHKYKVVDRTRLSQKKMMMAGTTDGGGAVATKDDVASSPDHKKEKAYEPKGDELQLNERSTKKVADAESRKLRMAKTTSQTMSECNANASEDQQPDQHVAATASEVVESKANGKLRRRRAKKTTKNALHE